MSLNRPQLRYQTTVITCAQQPIVLLPTKQLQQYPTKAFKVFATFSSRFTKMCVKYERPLTCRDLIRPLIN